MYKKIAKRLKALPLIVSIFIAAIYGIFSNSENKNKIFVHFRQNYDYNNILVTYVADGDTLKLEDGSWVRLIGIDAPEYHESEKLFRDAKRGKKDIAKIKEMGARSMKFTRSLAENKKVCLEFDVEKYDHYQRLLAYVFLVEDGAFLNAKIIEAGFAKTMTIPPNVKYADLFRTLQRQAKEEKRGLWRMAN